MMRALLVAVAWADIIACAVARAFALLLPVLPVLAVVFSVIAIRKRRRR